MWFLCFFCLNTPYGGRCASILQVFYKDSSAKGTPVVFTPEMERVKRNQENISSVPSEPPPEPAVNLFLTDLSLALVNCINEADVFDSTICSVSAHIITFNLSWWPHYSSSSLQRTEHNSTLNLSLLIHLSEVPVILPVTPCFPLHLYFFRFSVASNAKSYWMMPSGLKRQMLTAFPPSLHSPAGALLWQLPQTGPRQGRLRPGHAWNEARQGDPADHLRGTACSQHWNEAVGSFFSLDCQKKTFSCILFSRPSQQSSDRSGLKGRKTLFFLHFSATHTIENIWLGLPWSLRFWRKENQFIVVQMKFYDRWQKKIKGHTDPWN